MNTNYTRWGSQSSQSLLLSAESIQQKTWTYLFYGTILSSDILDIAKENEENGVETTKGKGLLLRFAVRAVDQPKQALGTPQPAV